MQPSQTTRPLVSRKPKFYRATPRRLPRLRSPADPRRHSRGSARRGEAADFAPLSPALSCRSLYLSSPGRRTALEVQLRACGVTNLTATRDEQRCSAQRLSTALVSVECRRIQFAHTSREPYIQGRP